MNKGITQPVVQTLAISVIGILSIFILFKWMQKPVEGSNTAIAPITTRALTVQPGTKPAGQVPYPVAKPTDLETLVAPIALYPDLLLTQLLPASTYPLEVVQAAHWLESKPYLAQASGQGWAPSIIELLRFPQLIFMMNEKLDWTAELGDRFLSEPDSVLAAIQSMRTRALSAGLLKDSVQQKVTKATVTKVSMDNLPGEGTWVEAPAAAKSALTRQIEVIRIEPANAQEIYVPQYNPQLLYSAQPSLAHNPDTNPTSVYDSTTSKIPPWLTYGAGVTTGALLGWAISEWNDDDWDDHYHGYYRQPHISYYSGNHNGYDGGTDNINFYQDTYISVNKINDIRKLTSSQTVQTPWVHDPLHRRGYLYPPQAQQRFATPKQQPALAGQRKAATQAVNSDYAGYERNELDRMRQTQMEKNLGHSIALTRKQPDETYSVFSGVNAGSQAQTFSKRGYASQTKRRLGTTHDGNRRK